MRAALGRPVPDQGPAPPVVPDPVAAALRGLPSHGWTQGMLGRRDRCLLVLSQVAGVPYKVLAALTISDIEIGNGAATVATRTDAWTVVADPDPVLCGPCAITRWVRVVDLAVTRITAGSVAAAVDKAKPVTHESPHLCRSTRPVSEATLVVPVFSSINQWVPCRSRCTGCPRQEVAERFGARSAPPKSRRIPRSAEPLNDDLVVSGGRRAEPDPRALPVYLRRWIQWNFGPPGR